MPQLQLRKMNKRCGTYLRFGDIIPRYFKSVTKTLDLFSVFGHADRNFVNSIPIPLDFCFDHFYSIYIDDKPEVVFLLSGSDQQIHVFRGDVSQFLTTFYVQCDPENLVTCSRLL